MEIELLQIEPTRKCNLNCKHCTRQQISPYGGDISIQQFISICDSFDYIGTIKIQGLGEPMMHLRINDLFNIALQYTPYVTTITNGTIPFESLPETKHSITISLNTLNPETYKSITGKDLLTNVKINIHNALNSGMKLHINCVQSYLTTPQDTINVINFAIDHDISFSLTPQEVWDPSDNISRESTFLAYENHGIPIPGRERYQTCPWTLTHMYYDYLGHLHPCCIRMDDKFILNDITDLNIDSCCSTCPL